MTNRDWVCPRGGPGRTARLSTESIEGPFRRRWALGVRDADILSRGIVATDGLAYLSRSDGLSVIDVEEGTQRWRYTHGTPRHGLVIDDDWVYLGTDDGIVVLDAANGNHSHTITVDFSPTAESLTKFVVQDGRIYTVARDCVVAFDTQTGDEYWRYDPPQSLLPSVAVGDDYVFALSAKTNADLVALDKDYGELVWRRTDAAQEWSYRSIVGVADGEICLESVPFGSQLPVPHVSKLSAQTAETISGTRSVAFRQTEWPLAYDGSSAFSLEDEGFAKGSLTSGEIVWTTAIENAMSGAASVSGKRPIAIIGDTIFGGFPGGIFGVNTDTGEPVCSYQQLRGVRSLAFTDGTLLAASDEYLHAIEGNRTKIYDS